VTGSAGDGSSKPVMADDRERPQRPFRGRREGGGGSGRSGPGGPGPGGGRGPGGGGPGGGGAGGGGPRGPGQRRGFGFRSGEGGGPPGDRRPRREGGREGGAGGGGFGRPRPFDDRAERRGRPWSGGEAGGDRPYRDRDRDRDERDERPRRFEGPRPGQERRGGYGDRPRRPDDRPPWREDRGPRRDDRPPWGDERPPRPDGPRPGPWRDERPSRRFDERPSRRFDERRGEGSDERPRRYEPRREGAPGGGHAPWRAPGGRPGDRPRPAPTRRPPAVPDSELLGEEEELVAGRRPVEEVFVAGRPALRLLVVPQRRQALERLVLHATNLRIPIVEVEGGTLTSLAGFDGHQGVAVIVPPRRYATLDEVLARAIERGEPPFVLALDSLEDPQNVGTLLRSAEAAGVHGVVFPTHRQAPLTPAAVKASAGAVEHLLLAPVDDLPAALADLHIRGLRIAGAEADAGLTVRQADLRGPLAIVVGSEGQGLGPAVRRRADVVMRIPMRGAIDSLNAAVAGSILLFEALAQRDPGGTSRPRAPGVFAPVPPRPEVATADDEATPAPDEDGASDGAPVASPEVRPPEGTAPPSEPEPAPKRRRATRPEPPAAAAEAPEPEPAPKRRRATRPEPPAEAAEAAEPAEPTTPKPRARRSTKAAEPAPETATGDADDDLLPGGPPAADDG
jgi:23S rRNA (guanosine2251-2'-O)-methyltransferase